MKTFDAYLCGYYGMQNSGDDALMYAAAWGARHCLNIHALAVSSPRNLQIPHFATTTATLSTQQKFRGQHRLEHYWAALRSKSIIFGGGSVLHSLTDINLKMDLMRLAGGHAHIAIGVGIGPFQNTAAETACGEFLRRCGFVGLRDGESYACAKSLAPDANLALTFDLAPALLADRSFSLQPVERSGIAINLCPVKDFTGESLEDQTRLAKMVYMIERLWQATGEPIYLIDINGHPIFGDAHLHRQLRLLLSPEINLKSVAYDNNPRRLLQRLASYKAIVSMRLHGAILGFLANTPVLSLNYHNKCAGWCDQINMPQHYRFHADQFLPEHLVLTLLDGLAQGFATPGISGAQATHQSLLNWRFSHATQLSQNYRCYPAI